MHCELFKPLTFWNAGIWNQNILKYSQHYLINFYCLITDLLIGTNSINQPMREIQIPNEDVFQRVNLYLDGRMSQTEVSSFRTDMNQNPAISEAMNHEQSFRDLLKNSVHRRTVSSDLIQNIKNKIRTAPH